MNGPACERRWRRGTANLRIKLHRPRSMSRRSCLKLRPGSIALKAWQRWCQKTRWARTTLCRFGTSMGRSQSAKVPEPSNAEELRRRLTIMRNALELVALRHTNRQELQGDYVKVFEDYKNYILGEYVRGLVAKDSEGGTVASPPWNLVLSYEHAVRKQAARLVNQDGQTWPTALKMAWRDATVKERNFTTPLALVAKRPAPPWKADMQQPNKQVKTQPKGKGKGKGKKGGGSGHCASHTPGGDMICYRYNSGEKCKASKCKYKHVCGIARLHEQDAPGRPERHPRIGCQLTRT